MFVGLLTFLLELTLGCGGEDVTDEEAGRQSCGLGACPITLQEALQHHALHLHHKTSIRSTLRCQV